ncbi:MAG: hypothetical protein DRI61_09670 [Chloroflexi bacterium]|nr:MAG: hypothetical protein DRI61_09670 [Chloroflexota bacterium]
MDIGSFFQHIKEHLAAKDGTEQQLRYNLLLGRYEPEIKEVLKKRNPLTHEEYHIVWINLYKMVVDRLGGAYYQPEPQRTFHIGGAPVEGALLERIEQMYNFDVALDKNARYTVAHRTVAVRVVWRHDRVELDVLPPMQWDVKTEAPDHTDLEDASLWVLYLKADRQTVLWVWDPEHELSINNVPQFYVLDKNMNVTDFGPNPYYIQTEGGRQYTAPVEVCRYEDPDTTFHVEGGEDLSTAALHVGYETTDIAHTVGWQSHGQPVFTNMPPDQAGQMVLSPSRGIGLNEGQKFEYVSAPSAIESRLKALDKFLAQLAQAYDLPADVFDESKAPESGVSRRLAHAPLLERRNAYAKRMADFEERLWLKIRTVWNAHSAEVNRIPETVELSVEHTVQTMPLDPTEQQETDIRELRLGVKSPVDLIVRDRGVTRDEALAIYQENIQINAAIGVSGMARLVRDSIDEGLCSTEDILEGDA